MLMPLKTLYHGVQKPGLACRITPWGKDELSPVIPKVPSPWDVVTAALENKYSQAE